MTHKSFFMTFPDFSYPRAPWPNINKNITNINTHRKYSYLRQAVSVRQAQRLCEGDFGEQPYHCIAGAARLVDEF